MSQAYSVDQDEWASSVENVGVHQPPVQIFVGLVNSTHWASVPALEKLQCGFNCDFCFIFSLAWQYTFVMLIGIPSLHGMFLKAPKLSVSILSLDSQFLSLLKWFDFKLHVCVCACMLVCAQCLEVSLEARRHCKSPQELELQVIGYSLM